MSANSRRKQQQSQTCIGQQSPVRKQKGEMRSSWNLAWDELLDGTWVRASSSLHLYPTAGLHTYLHLTSPSLSNSHLSSFSAVSQLKTACNPCPPPPLFQTPSSLKFLFFHEQQLGTQIDWKLWCSINNTINRLQMAQQDPGTPERSKTTFLTSSHRKNRSHLLSHACSNHCLIGFSARTFLVPCSKASLLSPFKPLRLLPCPYLLW